MVPKPHSPEVSVGSVEGETRVRTGALPFRKQVGRTPGVASRLPLAPPAGSRGKGMPQHSQGNSWYALFFPASGVHAMSQEWVINQPKGTDD